MYAVVGWMSEFYSTKTYQKKITWPNIYNIFWEVMYKYTFYLLLFYIKKNVWESSKDSKGIF